MPIDLFPINCHNSSAFGRLSLKRRTCVAAVLIETAGAKFLKIQSRFRQDNGGFYRRKYEDNQRTDQMEPLQLRKLSVEDLVPLRELGLKTFVESFSEGNTAENMQAYVSEAFAPEKLREELLDPYAVFYFAILGDRPVGYMKLNFGPSQTELQDEKAVEIERIYVAKEYQGQKLGRQLFAKALQVARERQADYIWLGVWEKNTRAIGFYKKIGFVEFGSHLFRLGEEEQTDLMMKLKI